MTFVTAAGMAGTKEQGSIIAGIREADMLVTRNSLGGVYFGFQSFQIGDRHRAAVDLKHSFCL